MKHRLNVNQESHFGTESVACQARPQALSPQVEYQKGTESIACRQDGTAAHGSQPMPEELLTLIASHLKSSIRQGVTEEK